MPLTPDNDKPAFQTGFFDKNSDTPFMARKPAHLVIENAIDHSIYDEINPEPGNSLDKIVYPQPYSVNIAEIDDSTSIGKLFNIALKMKDVKDDLSSVMLKIKLVKELKTLIVILDEEAQEGKAQILALLTEE